MSIVATVYRSLLTWPRQAVAREVPWKLKIQVSHLTKKLVISFWEPVILSEIRLRVHREQELVPFEMSLEDFDPNVAESLPSEDIESEEAYMDLIKILFRSVTDVEKSTDLAFRAQRCVNSISELLSNDLHRRTEHAKAIAQGHVQFNVGDVIRHKQFDYRGIVVGYDLQPVIDVSNWDGVRSSPKGVHQPFLHILSDVHDLAGRYGSQNTSHPFRYVASDNASKIHGQDCFVDTGHATIEELFGNVNETIGRFSTKEQIQYKYPLIKEIDGVGAINDYEDENNIIVDSARTIDSITRTILLESFAGLKDLLQCTPEHLTMHEENLLKKIRTQLESAQVFGESLSPLMQCFESVEKLIRVYGKLDSLIQKRKIIESFGKVHPPFELGQVVKSEDNNSAGVVVGWDVGENKDENEIFIRVVQDETVNSQVVRLPPERLSALSCNNQSILSHRSLHLYVVCDIYMR